MAAKGAESKELIVKKILETFEGSFKYDKELRIPMIENGEPIEIKVALTCAKTNVGGGEAVNVNPSADAPAEPKLVEPTEEEKANVSELLAKLGLV